MIEKSFTIHKILEDVMKKLTAIMMLFVAAIAFAGESSESVVVSGFGQIKIDSSGFTIPKIRVILCGPLETGIKGLKVSYVTYTEFDKDGKPELGFAQINFQLPKEWLPKIIIGHTLDPTCYQFPGPHQLPILNYPAALFSHPYGLGIFLQENWNGVWGMTGVTNGTAKFKDDNKSLDFTGRLSYNLPFGFTPGLVCWSGQQLDGYRRISGGDLTWKHKLLWINGGQNIIDYNGLRTGRWLFTTIDIHKYFQLVGLIESLKTEKTTTGWSAGVNFSPSTKSIIRLNLYKLAVNEKRGWGILFQQKF